MLHKSVGAEGKEKDSAVYQSPQPFPPLPSLCLRARGASIRIRPNKPEQLCRVLCLNWIIVYKFIQQAFIKYSLSASHKDRNYRLSGQEHQ